MRSCEYFLQIIQKYGKFGQVDYRVPVKLYPLQRIEKCAEVWNPRIAAFRARFVIRRVFSINKLVVFFEVSCVFSPHQLQK